MRLLIIEDEKKTASYLRNGLTEAGFVVDVATNGIDGLHLAETTAYDLVVCDVMLPGIDGVSVVESMRRAGRQSPVILLTARDSINDRVRGLDAGADDYLVKPFAFSELLARIRTRLRRPASRPDEVLRVADLELDPVRHVVTRGGHPITLTAREFSLLALFMQRQGEVLSRTISAERVWDVNFDSDTNVIDVAVGRLRQKVEPGFETRLIHTVRGRGYVLREPS